MRVHISGTFVTLENAKVETLPDGRAVVTGNHVHLVDDKGNEAVEKGVTKYDCDYSLVVKELDE